MKTLAQVLGETAPRSVLSRKAARLGLADLESLVSLAVARGCRHYQRRGRVCPGDPGGDRLSDEELVVLLLGGERPYSPEAIRCAAQMARSPRIDASRLAFVARRERVERVLAHIVRAGVEHDPEGRDFWESVMERLPAGDPGREPALPHWTRFVSMPGRWRGEELPTSWLKPTPVR